MVTKTLNRFLVIPPFRTIYSNTSLSKTIPTNLKGKSKGSQDWLIRQMNDPYVKKAKELNYRARSAFKLIEIDDKFKLLKKGITVVECGAAPGAWSQVVIDRINSDGRHSTEPKGRIIGIDLLPIEPLLGAIFLPNSDFTDSKVQKQIHQALVNDEDKEDVKRYTMIDLILSDMAPNASGILDLDQANLCRLVSTCIQYAMENSSSGSNLVAKVWQGSDLKSLEQNISLLYKSVKRFKPKSSRENSAELYLVAQGMRTRSDQVK